MYLPIKLHSFLLRKKRFSQQKGVKFVRKIHDPYSVRYNDLVEQQHRDNVKQQICYTNGITLIIIPFWWNRKVESVAHSIHTTRPDILLPSHLLTHDIIPTEMPTQRQQKGSRHGNQVLIL